MNERTVTRSRQSKRKRNADQALSRLMLDNQLDWCQPCYDDAPMTNKLRPIIGPLPVIYPNIDQGIDPDIHSILRLMW